MNARVGIANRAEIAVRIAATCRRLGAVPVLLAGEPDRFGFASRQIGEVELTGPAGSELDVDAVIAAAKRARVEFLHPGYGFLAERTDLAAACEVAGIRFVGPSAATLRACGDKLATRAAAVRAGVPVLPASEPISRDPSSWIEIAREIGYPVLVKPAGAGGGRGLRLARTEADLVSAIEASRREISTAGAGSNIYLERALIAPRHVEVQIAADEHQIIAVGDRDCSIQRRHQKVIEEAPAPGLADSLRMELHEYARRIAREVSLRGIATCEFLLAGDGGLAFLEVNPRIQVEHPVTEQVTGIDLVEWQLNIAAGTPLPPAETLTSRGHAIEARIYAEDPFAGFFPAPGRLSKVAWPNRPAVRIDAGYESGDLVPANYDAMIAKVIARGTDRDAALAELRLALLDTVISGGPTNLPWLVNLLDDPAVGAGTATTETASTVTPTMPDRSVAVLAAAAFLQEAPATPAADAWSEIGAWRALGSGTLAFHGPDWEEFISVDRAGYAQHLQHSDHSAPARSWRNPDGMVTVVRGDTVRRFAVCDAGGELEVAGAGGRWLMRPGPKPLARTTSNRKSTDGQVLAPLPATVLAVHVGAGDVVAPGQAIVTLYAMKMELVCAAPIAGTVATVNCRVGELVDHDQMLARVQPVSDS